MNCFTKGLIARSAILFCLMCLGTHTRSSAQQPSSSRPPAPAEVSSRVHIFYYDWYGAPPAQAFVHWQQGGHVPPEDIGSNFYPLLGPYSSADPTVLDKHMQWIRQAHVGVLTVTWWGKDSYTDRHVKAVLDAAARAGLKVNFHLEPYAGRTPASVADDIAYILQKYGSHPAFYRADFLGSRPLFYVYEAAHRNTAQEWKPATDRIHGLAEPVVVIAQTSNVNFVVNSGFDGGYTYDGLAPFRNSGFLSRWKQLARGFAAAGKLFIPSVGPGYWDDRAVRNGGAAEPEAARTRDHGSAATYDRAWKAAIQAYSPIVTVTSFNEWHEGSQIEPVVEHRAGDYTFPPYQGGPFEYLERTAEHVRQYEAAMKFSSHSK